jgi:hypothetical protein
VLTQVGAAPEPPEVNTCPAVPTEPANDIVLLNDALPVTLTVLLNVTLPVIAAVLLNATFPITAIVLENTALPVTATVLLNVAAPVTATFAENDALLDITGIPAAPIMSARFLALLIC